MNSSRRRFIQQFASAPLIVAPSVLGRGDSVAPNSRVTLGAIGVGNRGGGNVFHGFVRPQKDVRVVAACDCFRSRREKFAAQVNEHYQAKVCKPMADWREVLAGAGCRTGD